MKHCPRCKLDLPELNNFCKMCGLRLEASADPVYGRYCPTCGIQTKSSWRFCIRCSTELPAYDYKEESNGPESAPIPLTCPICRTEVESGARYCLACGRSIRSGVTSIDLTPDLEEPDSKSSSNVPDTGEHPLLPENNQNSYFFHLQVQKTLQIHIFP